MSKLPQINYPIYTVQLLSQKEPVQVRPFTVREEKLLLMAVSAADLVTTTDALKQIISNCVIGEGFDINNMAMIDMETIFLNLRARSIGEKGITYFKCQNLVPFKPKPTRTMSNGVMMLVEAPPPNPDAPPQMVECGMVLDVPVDFLNVPVLNKDTQLQIKFTEDVGVKMRFPTFDLFRKLNDVPEQDVEMVMVANCLDIIYDKDNAHNAQECTDDELKEFLLNLPGDKYEMLREFIKHVPQTHQESNIVCTKCKYDHKIVLEGLQDFFV
jgi:T4 bacteriophage base plate protein